MGKGTGYRVINVNQVHAISIAKLNYWIYNRLQSIWKVFLIQFEHEL